ncbi:hypothetical protein LINGRAHAP2_LOCUS29003 [Linum grandiflorum]
MSLMILSMRSYTRACPRFVLVMDYTATSRPIARVPMSIWRWMRRCTPAPYLHRNIQKTSQIG